MDKIKIGALNCQGIKEKYENPNFVDIITPCDIFGVSETWIGNEENKINIPGYKFYQICRKKEKGATRGGIGIFIREEQKKWIKVLYNISNENCLWCKLDKKYYKFDDDVYIGITYIPPENSSREKRINKDHFKTLMDTYTNIKSENVILIGDLNARTKNYEDVIGTGKGILIPKYLIQPHQT